MKNIKFWVLPLITMLALNLWSLEWSPPVGMDDTFISSTAHSFLQKNRFAQPMIRSIEVFAEKELIFGKLHLGGLAVMGFLLGPSITSDRLWSWSMAMVALWLLWLLAKTSVGSFWGIAAVVTCLVEPMFFRWAHMPRPEMTMTAIFLLGILSGAKALHKGSKGWFFVTGLCGTLAIDVHLSGVILAPSIGAAFVLSRGLHYSSPLNLLWFSGGAFLGLCWYITTHILGDAELFLRQWNFHIYLNNIIKGDFGSFLDQIPLEYLRYRQWFWGSGINRIRLLEGALILVGVLSQMRSKRTWNRYLAFVTFSLVITMALTMNRKAVYYLLPLYPLFVFREIAALRFLIILGRSIHLRRHYLLLSHLCRNLGIFGLMILFLFYSLQDLRKLHQSFQTDYARYVAEISAVVPEGPVAAGCSSLWYSMGKRNSLLSTIAILWAVEYEESKGNNLLAVSALIRQQKVQYIVVEPVFRDSLMSKDSNSKRSFRNFLESECRIIKTFTNFGYVGIGECPEGGITEVYEVLPNANRTI